MERLGTFANIVIFDFEYVAEDGEVPEPVCLVTYELFTGEERRFWTDELPSQSPYPTDGSTLYVTYASAGDFQCWARLGMSMPERVVDLYPEVRMLFYDRGRYIAPSLLNACRLLNIETMESAHKNYCRDLIINRKWVEADRLTLLDYCAEDVLLTRNLFETMYEYLTSDIPQWNAVLLRGRYMTAVARMERNGIPVDVESLTLVTKHWKQVQRRLLDRLDTGGVYENGSFKRQKFEQYLIQNDIPWPKLESGIVDLSDDVFRAQAGKYGGVIANIREARYTLGQMRLSSYTVGKDGRNRVFLNPFGSVTGRNQPSNSKFLFGSARWARSFIKPPPGKALAYIDWKSQEFIIAAVLSRDEGMQADYYGGQDVYLAFAVRAGIAPPHATKTSHAKERNQCKALVLGLSYGLTEVGLSAGLGISEREARHLMLLHREAYPTFNRWVEQTALAGALGLPLRTPYLWERRLKEGSRCNLRSMQNFKMQATGAEMMRFASSMLTEAGICVCAPVHDAMLIESDIDAIDRDVAATQRIMEQASEFVLGKGHRAIAEAENIVTYPDVFVDEKAGELYRTVMQVAREVDQEVAAL